MLLDISKTLKKNPLYILHQDKSMKDAKTRVRFLMLSLLNNVLF